jgi:hypothetical protein
LFVENIPTFNLGEKYDWKNSRWSC